MGVTENYDGCHSKIELDFIFPEKLLLEVNMDAHFLKEYANISTQRSRSITNEDRYAWEYYLHILDKEIRFSCSLRNTVNIDYYIDIVNYYLSMLSNDDKISFV